MRTAVIISGQARTFRHVWKNQWWMLLRHFPDADFFVSVADDEDAHTMSLILERVAEDRLHLEKVGQPDCIEALGMTEEQALEATRGAAMAVSSPPYGILRQLWHLERAYQLFLDSRSSSYDCIIRLRPDLHFHRFVMPQTRHIERVCLSAWWGGYGGINDRFAIMGETAAAHYFRTWSKVSELIASGCPLHPESLVAASLERGHITSLRELSAEFSALRPTGQLVWPDMQLYDLYR